MSEFPRAGDQFGAYLITGEVGRGGMGVVFAAQQSPLNRSVALKVLDPRFSHDPEFAARFAREAEILARMDSPHVIQVFDHGRVGDCLYLAMQRVSGGDLAGYLRREGPLPLPLAADLSSQVASALADAHSLGIIHRDVKPSNILLGITGHDLFAYLCDFGIAQGEQPGLTQAGSLAGSLAFTAPERHEGRPATERSDLYSLGCVLWTLITGHNPYAGTDFQIAQQHFSAPLPQVVGSGQVENELNRVLSLLLAKNPADRPPNAVEVVRLLRDLQRLAEAVGPVENQDRTRVRTPSTLPPLTGLPMTGLPMTGLPNLPGAGAGHATTASDIPAWTPGPPPTLTTPSGTGFQGPDPARTVRRSDFVASNNAPTAPAPSARTQRPRTITLVAAILAGVLLVGGLGWWGASRVLGSAAKPNPTSVTVTAPAPTVSGSAAPAPGVSRDPASRLATTIPLDIDRPHGIALDPQRDRVFIAGFGSQVVTVLTQSSGQVEQDLPVGAKPESVVVDPDTGLLLVACEGSSTVVMFDLSTLEEVGRVDTAPGALRITVDPATHLAYVMAQGSTSIQVINLEDRTGDGSLPGGDEPRAMAVDSRTRSAYVAHWGTGTLSQISLTDGSVQAEIPVGVNPNAVEISASRRLALVANWGDRTVTAIDLDAGTPKRIIPVGELPSRIAIDEQAGVAYVSCLASHGVYVIDLQTLEVLRRLDTADRPTGVVVDPATGTLYVTSFAGDVVQVFEA